MEKSNKQSKISTDNKATTPVTAEFILEQQKIFMQEKFLMPILFPKKVELTEDTSQEQIRNQSVEVDDHTSSSAQQKCVNYANCKKKYPSTCCRRMCFACCRADSADDTCALHHIQQLKKEELDRDFNEVVADIKGFKSFVHVEDKLTRICHTAVIWCLKDFVRYEKWSEDVFEKAERKKRMKLLELRRVKAYQQELQRQAWKQNGMTALSSSSSTITLEDGTSGSSESSSRKRKISFADKSKSLIEKFRKWNLERLQQIDMSLLENSITPDVPFPFRNFEIGGKANS